MRGVRWFRAIWRGASFSLKFAAVILVAGATIAVVPLMLAEASARAQAEAGVAQSVSIASNLIDGQRASLATFIADVGRQIAAEGGVDSTTAIEATLVQDTSVIGTDDVLGVVQGGGGVVAVRGSTPLGGAPAASLASAGLAGATMATTSGGGAWIIAASHVPGTTATAFVARPLTAAFIDVIDSNIATAAAPVGILLVRDGRTLTVAGRVASLTPALAGAIPTQPGIVSLESHQFAGAPVGWQSVLLLLVVILVAMLFIVVVVQVDLRRPLQRLDVAVAALGRGDFERPVHTGSIDEIGRLGASFEAMRMQVRSTMRITACRATVA